MTDYSWKLIENKTQWSNYKRMLSSEKNLTNMYKVYGLPARTNSEDTAIVSHSKYDIPEHYPCLVNSELNAIGGQYEHYFMYYDTAIVLVNSKEEQTR